MTSTGAYRRRAGPKDMAYFQNPHLWQLYPFLPLIRRASDDQEAELGILYDARGATGTFGYACTVFLVNLYGIPTTEADLFSLPKYVYDTFDELANDGWVVD
jgi:hypothetical protein